ncbi:hypothetical protein FB451DRAFT_1549704 [Mycena latifolia]|nr:hypothetical protein FB451DRAFT_1549704 [Mycena latifolia]
MRKMKRSATADAVNSTKRHLAVSNLKLGRVSKRNRIGRGRINSLPAYNPVKVEMGYGFPLYEAASVAASVIYWPEDSNGERERQGLGTAETDSTPKACAGLGDLPKYLPNGGTILSVHQPTTSLAWLEDNYDAPMVKSIRRSNVFSGPFAMMLFPEQPALAIFGPRNNDPKWESLNSANGKTRLSEDLFAFTPPDPIVVMSVQTTTGGAKGAPGNMDLVDDNGTGVRRANDHNDPTNPFPNRGGGEGSEQRATGSNPIQPPSENTGNEDDRPSDGDSLNTRGESDTTVIADLDSEEDAGNKIDGGKKLKGNGGGDPGDDGDGVVPGKWGDWISPIHMTLVSTMVQVNSEHAVRLQIESQTQFKTYESENVQIDLNQPALQQDILFSTPYLAT